MISDGKKTYKLTKPLKLGDKEISEVNFSEPCMEHLKGLNWKFLGFDEYSVLFGRTSDQPSIVFDKMKVSDGLACIEIMSDFLAGGQTTGQT